MKEELNKDMESLQKMHQTETQETKIEHTGTRRQNFRA
jgi:hypothetical protein